MKTMEEVMVPQKTAHLILAWKGDGQIVGFTSQDLQSHCDKLERLRRSEGEYVFLEDFRSTKPHQRESLV